MDYTVFWKLFNEKLEQVEREARALRPVIPREGLPDTRDLLEYMRAVKRAKTWEEVKRFLLNMRDPATHKLLIHDK